MADEGQNARSEIAISRHHWLRSALVVFAILSAGEALWRFTSAQSPADLTRGALASVAAVLCILLSRQLRRSNEDSAALAKEFAEAKNLVLFRDILPLLPRILPGTHLSIHHLFNDRDPLRPRGGGNVDMILDPADLPSTLADYLREVHVAGAKARILFLDPSSSLTERHRFVQQAGGDASAAAQHFRAKINAAIEELRPLATIRLFDALPPGNLIIVDDHIFWGGIPSVPSDASYPIMGITADTRENVYWAFRRNFDVLWKQGKPVDTQAPRTTRSIAAASL